MTAGEMVREFHEAYGLTICDHPVKPTKKLSHLRFDLLEEEFDEYAAAEDARDMVAIADALADIVYIAYGTAIAYGIPLDKVLAEVHASNMSKLGSDGEPILRDDGKVLKGPAFREPDIAGVLGV